MRSKGAVSTVREFLNSRFLLWDSRTRRFIPMKMPRNENIKVCKKISKSGGLRPSQYGNDPDYVPNVKELGNIKRMKNVLAALKRDKKKEMTTRKRMRAHSGPEFVPHSGQLLSGFSKPVSKFFHALGKTSGLQDDVFMREVEGLVGLWFAIRDNNNPTSIISSVFLYVRSFTTSSMANTVYQLAVQFFELGVLDTQSGFEGPVVPSWIRFLQDIRTNWKSAILSPLFGHFSKLLGLLVTLKICDASKLTWKYNDLTIFEPLTAVHTSALDLIDAVLGTITYFVEGVYYCVIEGSMRPLLTDINAVKLDEEFMMLKNVWELIKQGNLKYSDYSMDQHEFDRRLEALITQLKSLLPLKKSIEHSVLMGKINQLLQIKNDYITIKISSGVRPSPYVVELFGRSSRGKTTMGDQMIDGLMTSMGRSIDKGLRCTYNAKDAFMSTWTTDKEVLILDDFANTKKDFVQTAPTQVLVDVANNQPFYAPKAELEAKGKVFVEPKLVVVNTNKKDLDAYVYSNCPYSIQRRCHAVITVDVKDEFRKKDGGIDEKLVRLSQEDEDEIQPFDDIWEFNVEQAVEPADLASTAKYGPLEYKGKPLVGVNFVTVMQFLCDDMNDHLLNQENILSRMSRRKDVVRKCGHKTKGGKECWHIAGCCPNHKLLEPHFGMEVAQACVKAKNTMVSRIMGDLTDGDKAITGLTTMAILRSSRYAARNFDWIKLLPSSWLKHPIVRDLLMLTGYDAIKRACIIRTIFTWTLACCAPLSISRLGNRRATRSTAVLCALLATYRTANIQSISKHYYIEGLVARNDSISECVKSLREMYMPRAISALGVFGCLYGLSKIYRAFKEMNSNDDNEVDLDDISTLPGLITVHPCADGKNRAYCSDERSHLRTVYTHIPNNDEQPMSVHGNLMPTTMSDIRARDAEKCVWTSSSVRELDLDPKQRTCGFDGLYQNVQKNLVYVSLVMPDDQRMMVDCLFVRSNVVLLPSHIFDEAGIEVTGIFHKSKPDTLGGRFKNVLSKRASYHIPGTDMCLVYVSNGGSFKNLCNYFPRDSIPSMEFCMIWRGKDGELQDFYGKTQPQMVETTDAKGVTRRFMGGTYKEFTGLTFKGMCGAPMIVKGRFSCIAGFHLGGYTGTNRGCFGTLYQKELELGFEALAQIEGVLLSGLETTFSRTQMGVDILKPMEPHAKSPVRYVTGQSFNYHGQCPGMTSSHTDVKVMITSEAIMDVCGVPNVWGPPKIKPEYFGWQVTLDAISNAADPISHDLLMHCVVDYKEPLLAIACSADWCETTPLTDFETLNGRTGVKFITAMKLGTSMGYPLGGPKRPYVREKDPTPDKPVNREFDEFVMNEIRHCELLWSTGQRANCIASACKKDEVLPSAKEKCRIFYASPVALVWGVRKFFLPIVRMLQMHPLISECAVGINSYSPEWDQLMTFTVQFGENRIFGGDYKKYDTSLPSQLILASFRILIDIAKCCKYTSTDLVSMAAIAGDVTYSFIAYNGDLISLISNMGISGHALTVIINSICGSLLQRAAFYTFNSRSLPFREFVALVTYGDDNIGSSSEFVEHDNVTVSNFLKSINMEYTMPDKSSTMQPFLNKGQIEFLKRKSVYHKALNINIGALDENSIWKSLHCHVHGKKSPITQREAAAINISNALGEWFCHGPELYEKRRLEMVEVSNRVGLLHLVEGLFLSYDERVELWKEKYLSPHSVPLEVEIPDFDAHAGYEKLFTPIRRVETLNPLPAAPNRHKRGDAVSNLLPEVSKIDFSDWLPALPEDRAINDARLHCCTGKRVRESSDHMIPSKKNKQIGQQLSKLYKNQIERGLVCPRQTKDPSWEEPEVSSLKFEPHSGNEKVGEVTNAATVDFHDAPNDFIADMNPFIDSTRCRGEDDHAPIEEFFKRPVRIASYQWNVGSLITEQLNVWAQYFTNPRIANRINNYKLVRCTLHLKITVNGNGFYYGRAIAAYNPLPQGDAFFTNAGNFDVTALSQMPHVFVDPTHSLGGEMKCPFFYPYDYLDTADTDWYQIGTLHLRALNFLRHANAATDPITVNVFAWAEDMELAIPTMHNGVGMSPQSGNEMEEASAKGFISSRATAAAKTAGILSNIPSIRPYAMASQMALSSVASIAKLFGYSRPVNYASNNVVPRMTNSLALGNAPDTSQKLSLDCNQELSVDPSVAGLKEMDPLNIQYIVSHESYLTTFDFSNAHNVDDLIWNTRVDARLWSEQTVGANRQFAFTSTAFASMPFQYWSGTMKFRFQIVASAFHKGRLAFVWDPSFVKASGALEYNTNYIQIIDIAETQDFTIAIPNGTQYGMIKSPKPGLIAATQMFSTIPITTQLQDGQVQRDLCNGVLAVYVLNTLTAPDSTAPPIQINVFVSGGDDFEVHVPDDWYSRFSPLPFQSQSGFEPQSGMSPTTHYSQDYNAPQNGDTIYLGYKSSKSSEFNKVYTGEAITTLRMIIKRFTRWRTFAIWQTNSRWARFRHAFFPPWLGSYQAIAVSGPDATALGERYCYMVPSPLHWVTPAFKGFRGAMRHKIVPRLATTVSSSMVQRFSDTDGYEWSEASGPNIVPTTDSSEPFNSASRYSGAAFDSTRVPSLGAGGAIATYEVNKNLEIELPFYSQRRFAGARHAHWAALDTYDLGGYEALINAVFGANNFVDFYVAAGDDFQCLFYVGLPTMYYFATLPAA